MDLCTSPTVNAAVESIGPSGSQKRGPQDDNEKILSANSAVKDGSEEAIW
jgi:hypothetical protein